MQSNEIQSNEIQSALQQPFIFSLVCILVTMVGLWVLTANVFIMQFIWTSVVDIHITPFIYLFFVSSPPGLPFITDSQDASFLFQTSESLHGD